MNGKYKVTMSGKNRSDWKPFTMTVTDIIAVDKQHAISEAKTEAIITGMNNPRVTEVRHESA